MWTVVAAECGKEGTSETCTVMFCLTPLGNINFGIAGFSAELRGLCTTFCVLGTTFCVLCATSCVLGTTSCVLGATSCVLGTTFCVLGTTAQRKDPGRTKSEHAWFYCQQAGSNVAINRHAQKKQEHEDEDKNHTETCVSF